MKLFLDIRDTYSSGIARYASDNLRLILEFSYVKEVHIACLPGGLPADLKNNPVLCFHDFPFRHYSVAEQLKYGKLLKKLENQVDAFWFFHYARPVYPRLKKPIIVSLLDTVQFDFKYGSFLKRLAGKLLLKASLNKASQIICISNKTQASLSSLMPNLGNNSRVIYPPVVLAEGVKRRNAKDKTLLCIGNRKLHKNFQVVLQALSLLDSSWKVKIVGKRDFEFDELDSIIETSGMETRVQSLTGLSYEEVNKEIKKTELLIVPSLAEGFGYVPWEALSHGVLPILSDIPVFREVFADSGVYFNPSSPEKLASIIEGLSNQAREKHFQAMCEKKYIVSPAAQTKKLDALLKTIL